MPFIICVPCLELAEWRSTYGKQVSRKLPHDDYYLWLFGLKFKLFKSE
jgi:hypothetical protein